MTVSWLILAGIALIAFACLAQAGRRHPFGAMLLAICGGYSLGMGISLTIALEALLRGGR